ncbi:MAG: hypothetical protein AB8G77_10795 [Rhodothermales bacterium]
MEVTKISLNTLMKSGGNRLWCAFAALLMLIPTPAQAQIGKSTGAIGIGAQAGAPTGLTLKYYARKDIGVVFLGSWSLERFLLFSMHVTYEYPIPDSPLRFFIGPGLEIGREGDEETSDIRISTTLMPGLNFFTEKFEVFLQALPGVKLIPESKITLGGAVGLRYFF